MNMGSIALVAVLRRFSNIRSVSRAFLECFCRIWSVSLWLPFVQLCTLVGFSVALDGDVASNA